jgi:hypothetical protein
MAPVSSARRIAVLLIACKESIAGVRPFGTSLQQLIAWGMDAANPDWSPDGTKIVFQTNSELPPVIGHLDHSP